jgi:predicted dehydrogenase
VGNKGIIRVNQDVFEGTVYTSDSRILPFYRNQNDVIREAIRHFLDAIAGGAAVELPMAEAIQIIRLCEAWNASISTGKPVPLA